MHFKQGYFSYVLCNNFWKPPFYVIKISLKCGGQKVMYKIGTVFQYGRPVVMS